MEEILASIRRILNEEPPIASPPPPVGDPAREDVLMLDASMMVPEPAPEMPLEPPGPEPASAPQPAIPVEASHVEPAPPASAPPEPPVSDTTGGQPTGLVGAGAADAAASSIKTLVRTVASERVLPVHHGGPTIEEIVREELRPLLAQWLETHLPPLVERLVRAEIERVVSRAAE